MRRLALPSKISINQVLFCFCEIMVKTSFRIEIPASYCKTKNIYIVDYCLDYACEAVRFHTGVVHFLMGKEYLSDVKKGKTRIMTWIFLSNM
jgi:hypothetical protein